MPKIFVTGDTHGLEGEMRKFNSTSFPESKQLSKKDYVIILGDFGWLWYHDKHPKYKSDRYWLKWLHQKPWTTLFIDGNHENFDLLYSLEQVKKFNGVVGKVNESVFHLKRGYVYSFVGKTFFTFGGAQSSDKEKRKEGVTWWPQELPTDEEKAFGLTSLEQHKKTVDFVLTHTVSTSVIDQLSVSKEEDEMLIRKNDPTALYLERVADTVTFDKWFFGHFHVDLLNIHQKYTVLYKKIIRIV